VTPDRGGRSKVARARGMQRLRGSPIDLILVELKGKPAEKE